MAGSATDVPSACAFIAEHRPDLVVLNLDLPGDGLSLLRAGKPLHPRVRWVVVSPTATPLVLQRVLRAGAHGCTLEEEGPPELYAALREVAAGQVFLSDRVSELLLSHAGHKPEPWEGLLHKLSNREWQVFRRVAEGQGVTAIARELSLSGKTVETHERRICNKLNLIGAQELRAAAEAWLAAAGGRMCFGPDEWPREMAPRASFELGAN